jgi:hypothetical protein
MVLVDSAYKQGQNLVSMYEKSSASVKPKTLLSDVWPRGEVNNNGFKLFIIVLKFSHLRQAPSNLVA